MCHRLRRGLVSTGGAGGTARATGTAGATTARTRGRVLAAVAIAAAAGHGGCYSSCTKDSRADVSCCERATGSTGRPRSARGLRRCLGCGSRWRRSALGKGLAGHGRHQDNSKQLLHENSILVVIWRI